ncbi:uncharacterized protein LOC116163414 [Photinus pyralis]|nr:uncharacterized protein LOC116163414 [Photinus pyralis]XP_031333184.1 uncharacterized protein LOC116163414 [Photinus pyralis]
MDTYKCEMNAYDDDMDSLPDPFHASGEDDSDYIPETESADSRKQVSLKHYFASSSRPKPLPTTSSTCTSDLSNSDESHGQSLNKHKLPPILDGKFFQIINTDEVTHHIQAQCQLCLPNKAIIKGSLNITTNFLKHLKKKHSNKYDCYIQYKTEKITLNRQQKRTLSISDSSAEKNLKKQVTIHSVLKKSPRKSCLMRE